MQCIDALSAGDGSRDNNSIQLAYIHTCEMINHQLTVELLRQQIVWVLRMFCDVLAKLDARTVHAGSSKLFRVVWPNVTTICARRRQTQCCHSLQESNMCMQIDLC